MKSANYSSLLLIHSLALAVFTLSGCGNDINVSLAQNQKIVLYPNFGDHIVWHGAQVHFLVPLCKETDVWVNECHVNVKVPQGQFGQYNYICKGGTCIDPEVDVGSAVGTEHPYTGVRSKEPNPDAQVGLPCDGGTIKPSPTDVPDDLYGPITQGKIVQWLSQGVGPLPDWTITFDAGNAVVCNETDIHNADGYKHCTIKAGLASGQYKYTAASTKCTSGQGTVTVSQ